MKFSEARLLKNYAQASIDMELYVAPGGPVLVINFSVHMIADGGEALKVLKELRAEIASTLPKRNRLIEDRAQDLALGSNEAMALRRTLVVADGWFNTCYDWANKMMAEREKRSTR